MRRLAALLTPVFCCLFASAAFAAPPTAVSLRSSLQRQLGNVEREFVSAAAAMPAKDYAFAPTRGEFTGVRTFAQEVKHVTAVNNMVFSAMLGEKPPAGGEDGPANLKDKDAILAALRASFARGHRALAQITAANAGEVISSPFGPTTRPALVALVVGHCFDHYGQMVEYLRDNGIVPPASRR